MPATIRTAYAVSHRGGMTTYRARAFVEDKGVKHTFIVALGDTPDEATRDACKYVRDRHLADGITPPETIVHVGKMAGALVDAYLF